MKASNLADVGQIRRRKGTSIKRMTKEQALRRSEWGVTTTEDWPDSQADDSEGNASDRRKDVGNTKCKAQDHAHHAGPERIELEKMYFAQPEESQACPSSFGIGIRPTSRHITPLQRDRSSDGTKRRHSEEAKDKEFKELTIDRRYLGECDVSQAVIMVVTDRRLPLQQDEGYILKFRDRNSSASVMMGGWAMRGQ